MPVTPPRKAGAGGLRGGGTPADGKVAGTPWWDGREVRRKVVVVGAAEAGKSTLIAALCDGTMNLAVDGRTVAMDHGTLRRGGDLVAVVGVPGQERFEDVRLVLVEGACGAVWVQRASEPADPATASLLAAAGMPYIVVLNHQVSSPAVEWRPPPGLRPPRAVIEGDLARPRALELERLRAEIWELAAGPAGGPGGGWRPNRAEET